MVIGTSKSMSYLKQKHGLLSFFSRLRQHQTVSIQEQYDKYDVRAFDIHISFTGKNLHYSTFKYGNETYENFSVIEALSYLNRCPEKVYVRLLLEDSGNIDHHERLRLSDRFMEYCRILDMLYPDIAFFGGYRVSDEALLYEFDSETPKEGITFYKRIDKVFKKDSI